MARIIIKEFTSSGSWVCPAGVTKILAIGCGGGSGGSGGGWNIAGGGSEAVLYVEDVVPNTTYTITIGTGGAGGDSGGNYGGVGGWSAVGGLSLWEGAGFIKGTATESYSGAGVTQGIRDNDYGNCVGGRGDYFGGCSNRFDPGTTPGTDGAAAGGAGGFGDGGNGVDGGTAESAAANSGGGGGAGGTGDTGGAGGTGYIQIIWSE